MSTREKWKTYGNVFDQNTLRTIFKLSGQGHFDNLEGPVSIGKEANIFTAKKGDDKVIVKIYRVEACDFNKMYSYIRTDPRYENLKRQRRQIIFAWVQREFRNLLKAREAGVSVPKPIAFANNVLVLEYIGNKSHIAPKIKDLKYDEEGLKIVFDEVILNMKKLLKIKMIHGDLSEFNILYDDRVVFIDFSQATMTKDDNAKEYYKRDIANVYRFFEKKGLKIEKGLKAELEKLV